MNNAYKVFVQRNSMLLSRRQKCRERSLLSSFGQSISNQLSFLLDASPRNLTWSVSSKCNTVSAINRSSRDCTSSLTVSISSYKVVLIVVNDEYSGSVVCKVSANASILTPSLLNYFSCLLYAWTVPSNSHQNSYYIFNSLTLSMLVFDFAPQPNLEKLRNPFRKNSKSKKQSQAI